MKRGKLVRLLLALLLALGGLAVVQTTSASPAQADPGFCGVRHDGPDHHGSGFLYVVRNKCGAAIRVRIVVQGINLYCQTISAYSYGAWTTIRYDVYWTVRSC